MKITLIINDLSDPRAANFGKLFGRITDTEVFSVSAGGGLWVRLDSEGLMGPPLELQDRPSRVDVLLVHGSDWDTCLPAARTQLSDGIAGGTFIFNGPGDPPRKESAIRILRPTNPFTLSDRDANQIVAYATNPSAAIPSCCAYPAHTLIALEILCHGYRAVHADSSLHGLEQFSAEQIAGLRDRCEKTEKGMWWQNGLQLKTLDELKDRLQGENVPNGDIIQVCSKLKAVVKSINEIGPHVNLSGDPLTQKEQKALSDVRELHDLVGRILK